MFILEKLFQLLKKLNVVVLEIDVSKREEFHLGIKQCIDNPWETL